MKARAASLALAILVIFIPAELTLIPCSANNAPQSNPAQSDTKASSEAPKLNPRQDDKVRIGTNLVSLTVSVTDTYGRFVTGLNRDHFEVFDDKVKQQIAHFSGEDAPVSLGIVYDVQAR